MCHDANAEFATFASDKTFQKAHPAPKPVALLHGGKNIEFPVEGGANGRAFLMTSHGQSNKYLLIFHEWWGLNDNIRNQANRLAHELGVNVLAVDLYDGQLAETPEDAGKLMQACDPARASAIIQGAAKYAGENADFRVMGWCFGGGWSLQAALLLGDKAKACVIYYGMPEKDVEKLKTLQTDVLMIHAKQDKWINDATVAEFKKNMEAAGKSLTVSEYDADHAFSNPSGPRYNEQASREARAVVLQYLRGK
ncbi:MAG: dienelactone hydrolase family protein [Lewinellaceae bacterium]|nr:dienelactone hydrolase family protein [Lewinellaceae bacterium]